LKLFTHTYIDFERILSCSSNIHMVRGFASANDVTSSCETYGWSSRLWRYWNHWLKL